MSIFRSDAKPQRHREHREHNYIKFFCSLGVKLVNFFRVKTGTAIAYGCTYRCSFAQTKPDPNPCNRAILIHRRVMCSGSKQQSIAL